MKSNRGFTLIEVLVAMFLMVMTFAVILRIQTNSIEAIRKAKELNTVSMLSKKILAQTEWEFRNKGAGELPDEESGKFDEPYEEYQWKRGAEEVAFSDDLFSLGEQYEDNPLAKNFGDTFVKYLKNALRKVTVTVLWPNPSGGNKEFSVVYFWVNYNEPFSLSGLAGGGNSNEE